MARPLSPRPGSEVVVHPAAGLRDTGPGLAPTGITPREPEPGLVDALALAARYADELVVHTVRDTHRAIADRVFALAPERARAATRTPRAVHDAVSSGWYGSASLSLRATAAGLSRVGATGIGPRLNDSGTGRAVHAAVNGLVGDRLRDEHPHLALTMTLRVGGRVVEPQPTALADAFPKATGRVLVLVPGWGETEDAWEQRTAVSGGSYGSRLEAEAGWTPVHLRANSGLSVAENGVALTALLQRLVDHWPVGVRQVALVGHSMGGLIIRAGCAVATPVERPWTDLVTDVVTLGTPHLGADLARGVHHGSRLLARLPEVAGLGRVLDHRSPGVRDLERGLPDLPPLPHVRYRLVSAALGSERNPLGWLLGDLLVRRGSATGSTRRALRLFPDADVLHVPNADHFALLDHPEVHRALARWLA